jgi:ubiquinone/menaquinone biosynthesis C-methylase UbiE
MSVFDSISSLYDQGMLPLEMLILRRLRRRIFPALRGDVLELGVGTGVNLPLYNAHASVTGFDASAEMLSWAARRMNGAPPDLVQGDAQRLPFADERFDVVAASLLFCSVADPAQGLAEARRVLRPGGRLMLLEHARGRGLGRWLTDLLHPVWRAWSRSCCLNRETARTVSQVGFDVQNVERRVLGIFQVIEALG